MIYLKILHYSGLFIKNNGFPPHFNIKPSFTRTFIQFHWIDQIIGRIVNRFGFF